MTRKLPAEGNLKIQTPLSALSYSNTYIHIHIQIIHIKDTNSTQHCI